MSLGDRLFEGSHISYAVRYAATWVAMVPSSVVAVAAWSAPVVVPGGRWMLSLLGVLLFAFCVYANRELRRRMLAERSRPAPH